MVYSLLFFNSKRATMFGLLFVVCCLWFFKSKLAIIFKPRFRLSALVCILYSSMPRCLFFMPLCLAFSLIPPTFDIHLPYIPPVPVSETVYETPTA